MDQSIKSPKVSVCVITYNQEKYIRQCLQSIVDQETDFDFEVIVGDDCSTDNTASIVQEFAERYPKLIRPIFLKKNTGGCGNYMTVHLAAKGEYVAHIDGDDAMLPHKLECQAKLMDENPYCPASFHLMEIIDEKSISSGKLWLRDRYNAQLSIDDILMGHPNIGHSSIMYRKACLRKFFSNRNSDFLDLHIYLALASQGPLLSINKKLGLYRIGVGASAQDNVLDFAFDAVENVKEYGVSEKVIAAAGLRLANSFIDAMLIAKRHNSFVKYWNKMIFYKSSPNFLDSTITSLIKNRLVFNCIANLRNPFIWTRNIMRRVKRLFKLVGSKFIPASWIIKATSKFAPSCKKGANIYLHPSVQMLGAANVSIGSNTCISEQTWLNVNHRNQGEIAIQIGDNCFIGRRNFFSSGKKIEIGHYVLTTIDCKFVCSSHITDNPLVPYITSGTTTNESIRVGTNCFFGAGAMVLGNVVIGHCSVIGAGSLVTKDVPPFSLVVGSPAKILRRYSFSKRTWIDIDLVTDDDLRNLPNEEAYLKILRHGFPKIAMPVIAAGSDLGNL